MASVVGYFGGRKGLALGIFYVGFDAGSVAGLSIGGIAYSISGSWRPAFFLAPLFGIFVVAGILFFRRRVSDAVAGRAGGLNLDTLRLLTRPNIFLLMIFVLLATWSSVWQVAFLPYYFFKVMHFTILSSALLSSLVIVAGALGKILLGGISDLIKRTRLLSFITLATLLSFVLFFFSSSNFSLDLIGALFMGFFSAAIFPVMQALVTDSCGENFGSALGLSTSFQSVATIFGPIITASLFVIGVGRAVAIDALLPIGLAFIVAIFLKDRQRSQ